MFTNEKRRLLYSFLIVGLLNFIIITFFLTHVYSSRKHILVERAELHMTSVRSLTLTKISLYFDKLKSEAIRSSRENFTEQLPLTIDKSVIAVWKITANKILQIAGSTSELPEITEIPPKKFSNYQDDKYLLKVEFGATTYVWLYNGNGINDLLLERDGLGHSGEVYLVDSNSYIQSASRHVKDWATVKVDNKSVELAQQGKTGVALVKDYRNIDVISAYTNLHYDLIKYILLSELDLKEVLKPLDRTLTDLGLLSISLIILNILLALYLSRNISKRLMRLKEEINQLNINKEKNANISAIQVMRAQEDEREKMSFNLHDSVGQYLTVLKWGLNELKQRSTHEDQERIDALSKTCDDIIHEIRTISHDLMPTLIKDFGCCLAIKDYLQKQRQIIPLKIDFAYEPELENYRFRKEFETNLYRMAQEFFQNSLKHSLATHINLQFEITDSKFIMKYYDDGKGMREDAPLPASIHYRAKLFEGEMIRLKQEKGLAFQVTFNLKDIGL